MLTEILGLYFKTEKDAKSALTAMRKRYRVALRGSVACERHHGYTLYVNLSGSGFSAEEFKSAVWGLMA